MTIWNIKEKQKIPAHLTSIHPITALLLQSRGISDEAEMNKFLLPDYERDIHDPFLFHDMEKVVERIKQAKLKNEKVLVFGDYDADGITSSAIMKETFNNLEIEASIYIPDKRTEGYGLNDAAIDLFAEQKINLIITVDCGITNVGQIAKANSYGIDVIVVDHHHVPTELPQAYAIINPHMENSGYPFSELAGVGVAFKVVQAVHKKLLPEKEGYTKWMLDLVAIGTVADCVPLIGENRVLVKYGLIVLSKTRRTGIQQLFKVGRILIDEDNIPDTKKISFQIAPRINAAGRIDHANLAYNLVVENDVVRARNLALELEASNGKRQRMTEEVGNEVRLLAQSDFRDKKFIFACEEHFPIGIVGLVAGKIAQEFNKPTAIFQKGEFESTGSFRSIPQVNIIETIERCGFLLKKFGGHSQAAGVTVTNDKMEAFCTAMNDMIEKQLEGKDMTPEILIDAEISPADVDFNLLNDLERLEPFGEGNPQPLFLMKNLLIDDVRIVGNGKKHLKLMLRAQDGTPKIFDAIGFNTVEKFAHLERGATVDAVFSLQKDEWNGNKKIQMMLIDLQSANNSI